MVGQAVSPVLPDSVSSACHETLGLAAILTWLHVSIPVPYHSGAITLARGVTGGIQVIDLGCRPDSLQGPLLVQEHEETN